jgi:hypothetical protein
VSGYQQETQELRKELNTVLSQIAGYLNQPESEVSDNAKLIGLAVLSVGMRLEIAAREQRLA